MTLEEDWPNLSKEEKYLYTLKPIFWKQNRGGIPCTECFICGERAGQASPRAYCEKHAREFNKKGGHLESKEIMKWIVAHPDFVWAYMECVECGEKFKEIDYLCQKCRKL